MSQEPDGAAGPAGAALVPSPVRIIGTGLIGGSLGLALRSAGADVQVQDVSPGTTALAIEMGVGRRPTGEQDVPALVLVAAPPDVAAPLVADALVRWPEAIVADAASVKATVLAGLRQLAASAEHPLAPGDLSRYVGAHPMAGREVAGVISARGDLFRARPFVVVPHDSSRPDAVARLRALALEIGAIPLVMDADAHDRAVALVSHVPQVTASLLATSLLDAPESALGLAGQGLRDTSRIAASDPRLWVEILGANAAAVAPVLERLRERLDGVIAALRTMDGDPDPALGSRRAVADLIADGNAGVRRIPGKHGGASDSFATITVLVPDRPGELARLLGEIGQIGVNLEDLQLEHTLGRRVGLAHVSVHRGSQSVLTQELRARDWTVADA